MYYVAMFLPHKVLGKKAVYDVMFPDVPGCYSQGDSLEKAYVSAAEALHCHLGADDPATWPPASSLEDAKAKAEREAALDGLKIPDGAVFQLVQMPAAAFVTKPVDAAGDEDHIPVKLSLSMRPRLVARSDKARKQLGLTRSGLVAQALDEYLQRRGL
ncbi:MAG: type II toxin-antitoxin system HicB family antitoxin [Desulfarculales bacterium]|nr:type II toxin-antitoxin system HicB family antitoxin [Desulfarculales bacterium]